MQGYSNNIIEDVMEKFRTIIGKDFDKYKNHVYRVFLNCLLVDNKKSNEEKYAIASLFHDIGIWTNKTFDYLDPSIEQAQNYLNETGKENLIAEIALMIYWHHKIRSYRGIHESIVNNFRKADWIDVSLGLRTFGIRRKNINEIRNRIPNLGFHLFLVNQAVNNFFRHPFNPLPMFKR